MLNLASSSRVFATTASTTDATDATDAASTGTTSRRRHADSNEPAVRLHAQSDVTGPESAANAERSG